MIDARPVTAKTLILDVLRASHSIGLSVSKLVEFASLFDITDNSIRVTLSRLVTRDLITADVRGHYRMSANAEPMGEWIDFWMQGEDRVTTWNGQWVGLLPPNPLKKQEWGALNLAAQRFGFKMVQGRYWVRPDNLTMSIEAILKLIERSSKVSNITSIILCVSSDNRGPVDLTKLWDTHTLEASYQQCKKLLEQSMHRHQKDRVFSELDALKESYLLGGHAINILALDPLLPESMVNVKLRSALSAAMLEYNELFQSTWLNFLGTSATTQIPINQTL